MNNKEAWEYVLKNEKLIWYKIHSENVPESIEEDVFNEACIELRVKLMDNTREYIEEKFNSILNSAFYDGWKKCYKTNASDYKHLQKRKVIPC